ncbi:MAG: three-Cys-motif partner protein TcmP [Chloroflexi bacterium]|nr:three-Cys-motif partner protein TcmP [Chloroflexota bacterium]
MRLALPDLIASDGLAAFPLQPWTRTKLLLIDGYLGIFTVGMRRQWRLVYADLFAGPGLCVDEDTGEERPGSSLMAARHAEFDAVFLNDVSPDAVAALKERVGGEHSGRVRIAEMDCNDAATAARKHLFTPADERSTLGLAVIDPTAFQISFDAIRQMTSELRIDLIITFMTGYIRRFIGEAALESALDRFFGTDAWRNLIPGRSPERLTYRALLDLYEDQLRSIGYTVFDDRQQARNRAGASIYHMVYASKHERGGDFWEKISQRDHVGRVRLPGFD